MAAFAAGQISLPTPIATGFTSPLSQNEAGYVAANQSIAASRAIRLALDAAIRAAAALQSPCGRAAGSSVATSGQREAGRGQASRDRL